MTETNQIDSFQDATIVITAVFVSIFIVISSLWILKYYCCRSLSTTASDLLSTGTANHMYDVNGNSAWNDNTDQLSPVNSSGRPIVPFSTKVRGMFLEAILQHETFHSKTNNSRLNDDIEKGNFGSTNTSNFVNDDVIIAGDDVGRHAVAVVPAVVIADEEDPTAEEDIVTDDAAKGNRTECDKDTISTTRSLDDSTQSVSSNDDSVENSDYCAICYETLHEGDDVTTSNCQKTFHRKCIIPWLMQHDTCPYCRNAFKNVKDGTNEMVPKFRPQL